jgi:cell division protein FtsB
MLSGRASGSITPRRFISIFAATVLAYLLLSNAWTNLVQPAFNLWQEKQQLQADITKLEGEQQQLLDEIKYRQTPAYIVEMARKWLLMTWPGERIIVPVPQAERTPEQKAPSEESQTQPPSLWQQFQNWLFGGP